MPSGASEGSRVSGASEGFLGNLVLVKVLSYSVRIGQACAGRYR